MGYWRTIGSAINTIRIGMGVTLRHLLGSFGLNERANFTYVYNPVPRQLFGVGKLTGASSLDEKVPPSIPNPDLKPEDFRLAKDEHVAERHRGIHYLETHKCILCWACAKACPVSCIQIEGLREGKGREADFVFTRFTIDYSKCIFCGLCTEPCPTDCIHHGREWDFSAYNRDGMVKNMLTGEPFTHAEYEQAEKDKAVYLELQRREKAAKAAKRKAGLKAQQDKGAAAKKAGAKATPKPKSAAKSAARDAPKDAPGAESTSSSGDAR